MTGVQIVRLVVGIFVNLAGVKLAFASFFLFLAALRGSQEYGVPASGCALSIGLGIIFVGLAIAVA